MDLMPFLGTITDFREIRGSLRIAWQIPLYSGVGNHFGVNRSPRIMWGWGKAKFTNGKIDISHRREWKRETGKTNQKMSIGIFHL